MGKTNTRALSLKKPPRFKASCLQSWRFFDVPCYWALTQKITVTPKTGKRSFQNRIYRKSLRLTKSTKTMQAPKMAGIKGSPHKRGPQLPNRSWPSQDPTQPTKILPIQPIRSSRSVKAVAISPVKKPVIIDTSIGTS